MAGAPTVSVVIATYNSAPYLAESLDSVFAQTWRDVEIVVVDDGSTDGTDDVLARFPTVRVVRTPHGGYGAARNAGLAAARGTWIAFHDADDVLLPDRLAVQLAFVEAHPGYGAVFADGARLDDPGMRLVPERLRTQLAARPLTAVDLFEGFPVFFQAALVRRDVFAAAGEFDPSLRIYADLDYGYRLIAACAAGFLDRVVFRYRIHGTNVTRDRLRGREELARILEGVRGDPALVRAIGGRRLDARLARHCFRIGRQQLHLGQHDSARAALRRAARLCPLHPAYQFFRLWHASRAAT